MPYKSSEDRKNYNREYNQRNKKILTEKKKLYISKNEELVKEKRKARYEQNKEYYIEKARKRYAEKKEDIQECRKIYREKNREDIKKKKRLYYDAHKNDILAKVKQWRSDNNDHIRAYKKYKMDSDPIYRIRQCVRNRFNSLLRRENIKKTNRVLDLLGCSVEEFQKYMESKFLEGMSWENHSVKGWHIDHIKPCSSFNLSDPEQQKQCFHYSNLQPLWWYDNLSKGDKI